jgi:hypothetical protein
VASSGGRTDVRDRRIRARPDPLSADERKAALDSALSIAAAKGYRIESRSD